MKNKILIIDDVDFNREILSEILKNDYEIISVDNGYKALVIIDTDEKNEIAAILLDLIMPQMDGFEVLAKLNERSLIGRIPVLVISGETVVETQKKMF